MKNGKKVLGHSGNHEHAVKISLGGKA